MMSGVKSENCLSRRIPGTFPGIGEETVMNKLSFGTFPISEENTAFKTLTSTLGHQIS